VYLVWRKVCLKCKKLAFWRKSKFLVTSARRYLCR